VSARTRVTAFGDSEALVETVRVIGTTGARSFELAWTHPDYPLDRDAEPPAGVPVTWTVAALYRIKNRGRRAVDHLRTASAHGADHERTVTAACLELLRSMGANVVTMGDAGTFDGIEVVPTPAAALKALS
jgi:hypothetical protein